MSNGKRINNLLRQFSILCLAVTWLVSCGGEEVTAGAGVTTVPPTAAKALPTSTPQAPLPAMENVIPRPVSVVEDGGTFVMNAQTVITVDPGNQEETAIGQYLANALNPATGYSLQVQPAGGSTSRQSISLSLSGADPALGAEGYQLKITPAQVTAVANQPVGLFYAVQTIRQLLPPAIDSASVQPGPWSMGTGTISDHPRFAWRGAMLDVARHFFSVQDVTKYIDLLAYYKINHLHLHLTDDQGWRIQINSWPNLVTTGGSLEVGGTPGGYYSQADYAYIVEYARSRYITIVPEIDMPGHINSALVSYPELDCSGTPPQPYTGAEAAATSLCVNQDGTYTFLENVIGELAAITPGPYIHIGGDEAQATNKPDYINFMQRVQAIVQAAGKQAIGWEEIAQARLLPGTVVQHWNLDASYAPQAVQEGAKLIMSPADKVYLDMKYDATTPLGQDWAGLINLQTAYSWDPASLLSGVSEDEILGVEAPLWSETLTNLIDLENMAFPRILEIAEVGWTPQAARNWIEFRSRLAAQGPRLTAMGVVFYRSPEIAWP